MRPLFLAYQHKTPANLARASIEFKMIKNTSAILRISSLAEKTAFRSGLGFLAAILANYPQTALNLVLNYALAEPYVTGGAQHSH
jgi:hypothetical protein